MLCNSNSTQRERTAPRRYAGRSCPRSTSTPCTACPRPSARQAGPQGHLAGVPARRQDRRAGLQRRGQVDAAADHGRRSTTDFRGEARLAPDAHGRAARAGAAARRDQGRAGNVEDGVRRDARRCSTASTSSAAELLRRDRRGVRPSCRSRSTPPTPGTSTRMLEHAMDALRLPPADAEVTNAVRRRAPPRGALPAAAARARPAAARRADQPPRRRVGGLAGAPPRGVPGHVVAVTHDRYFLDNVAGWILELDRGRGIPYEGNYSSWLEQKQERLAAGGEAATTPASARSPPSWSGCARAPRAGAKKSKARLNALRGAARRGAATSSSTRSRSTSRPARASATWCVEAEDLRKGFGDRLLIEDLSFNLPPGGIVGVIGPNGAGKTTLFRMITGQEQPDGGTLARRRDRRSSPTSTSRATRSIPRRPSGRRSPAATTRSRSATAR